MKPVELMTITRVTNGYVIVNTSGDVADARCFESKEGALANVDEIMTKAEAPVPDNVVSPFRPSEVPTDEHPTAI